MPAEQDAVNDKEGARGFKGRVFCCASEGALAYERGSICRRDGQRFNLLHHHGQVTQQMTDLIV